MAALFVGGVVGGYAYTQDPGVPSLLLVLIVVVLALLVLHVFGFHQDREAASRTFRGVLESRISQSVAMGDLSMARTLTHGLLYVMAAEAECDPAEEEREREQERDAEIAARRLRRRALGEDATRRLRRARFDRSGVSARRARRSREG